MTTPETLFELATEYAKDETKFDTDSKYGCGFSVITIKLNNTFGRWAKKEGKVQKDGYYGNILKVESGFSGTLEEEKFYKAFAEYLNKNAVHAFVRTRLD